MTAWVNYADALRQLKDYGLDINHLEFSPDRFVRCKVVDGGREKRGWYRLHEFSNERGTFITGSYGIWRGNDDGKQLIKLNGLAGKLSDDTQKAIRLRHAENLRLAQARRAREHERAALKAAAGWKRCLPSSQTPSLYLQRKGINAYGIRFSPSNNGNLLIPMCDAKGKLWGLQIIRNPDNGQRQRLGKQYWPAGMAKTGHYHMIGSPGAVILLCEGYATAASVYAATGICTVVAFDANNLLPVAQALHKAYRHAKIMVCADDDYLTQGNPGVTAAQNAALAVGGHWCIPDFPSDRGGKKLTDFNDLANVPDGGLHLVRAQIEAAFSLAGIDVHLSRQRLSVRPTGQGGAGTPEGEGDGARRAEAIMPLDDLIDRFIPIDDGTGDYVFDLWTRKMARKSQMIALLPAGVRGDDIKAHPEWRKRGAYFIDQVGFDPTERDPLVKLNTWRGWPLTPRPEGSCTRLLDLLRTLCSLEENADEVYHWLLQWMAYPLQHPGAKLMSAVIMHGPQGTGKSTVFQALGKIYGDYATILNQRGLEDKFNSDWADSKLYMLAEEVIARQDMWHIKNELKELVTGKWIRVNPKNLPAYRQRNHINIAYLSNENQPLPLENDDRRHLVVYTPPMQEDRVYRDVHDELNNGGLERFYHYLLHEVDTRDFRPNERPPMTKSKQALIDLSLPSEAAFIKQWQEGQLELSDSFGALPFCPCTGRQLYTAYKRWAGIVGVQRPRDETQFIGYVKRLPGWQAGKVVTTLVDLNSSTYKSRKMVIPGPAALTAAEQAGAKTIPEDEGHKSRSYWLTQGCFAFANALELSK